MEKRVTLKIIDLIIKCSVIILIIVLGLRWTRFKLTPLPRVTEQDKNDLNKIMSNSQCLNYIFNRSFYKNFKDENLYKDEIHHLCRADDLPISRIRFFRITDGISIKDGIGVLDMSGNLSVVSAQPDMDPAAYKLHFFLEDSELNSIIWKLTINTTHYFYIVPYKPNGTILGGVGIQIK
jgi:hypothetical protein